MQIHPLENTNSNLKFGSKHKHERASAFMNMDDSQLKEIAYLKSIDKKEEKKQQNSLMRLFYALPIVETISSGILVDRSSKLTKDSYKALKYSPLSTRAEAAAKTAASWGFILAAVGLFNATKKALGKKSSETKGYEQEHPIGSLILDMGTILGGIILGNFALHKFAPEQMKEFKTKFKNMFAKLDDTKFNKENLPKIVKDVSKSAKKAPRLAKAGRFALVNSLWIFLGAILLKSFNYAHNQNEKIEQNYQELKQQQFETAKYLANEVGAERDILAQNQVLLIKELRYQMSKSTKPIEKEESAEPTKPAEEEIPLKRTHHPEPDEK